MDDLGMVGLAYPTSISALAEYTGLPRSSITRTLKMRGHLLPPVDPLDPESYKRVTQEMANDILPVLKRSRRTDEVTLEQLAPALVVSPTSIRRYIALGVIVDYTKIQSPRNMYVFDAGQVVKARERVEWYMDLKTKGYRLEAMAQRVAERNALEGYNGK